MVDIQRDLKSKDKKTRDKAVEEMGTVLEIQKVLTIFSNEKIPVWFINHVIILRDLAENGREKKPEL